MASSNNVPVIQVLEREHYFNQALVSVPSALPYPSLAPSSLRIRTKLMSLSANNFTYAKFGFLFNWWNVYPIPEGTPSPYSDTTKYGRVSAWGWAEVVESTHDSVPVGSMIWGYVPIGTLAHDVKVRDADVPGQILAINESRQILMSIYNRYFTCTGTAADDLKKSIDSGSDSAAYDALVRVMFETAYLMNRYMFGTSAALPSNMPGVTWTAEQANIKDATIINLAPGSKAGLCFVHELRHARGDESRARQVIGAASEISKSFVEGTGLYDAVVSSREPPVDVLTKFGVADGDKVVLADFGGRGNAMMTWAMALAPKYKNLIMLTVGSEIVEVTQAQVLEAFQTASSVVVVNVTDIREQAVALDGEKAYVDKLEQAWGTVKKEGFRGLKVKWGIGMDDVKQGWDTIAKGEAKPDEGLVFRL
ncbi:hypothetical protein F5Y16DRAFT_407342 [Xylariaceae sp. FL0255]|nr:hypothetical protein F5Y16DRAFT_407342 [Xylariaceae sp. FL0255]